MDVSLLEQLTVVFGDQTDHVVVELFLLVHGDRQIGFTDGGKQPDEETKEREADQLERSTRVFCHFSTTLYVAVAVFLHWQCFVMIKLGFNAMTDL